jgi:hypothetical protein
VHAIGWVTKRELSVDMLRHLAEDAGAPKAEIDAITQPEITVLFIADAVIMQGGGLDAPAVPAAATTEGEAK